VIDRLFGYILPVIFVLLLAYNAGQLHQIAATEHDIALSTQAVANDTAWIKYRIGSSK
jgi:hypothetical protein